MKIKYYKLNHKFHDKGLNIEAYVFVFELIYKILCLFNCKGSEIFITTSDANKPWTFRFFVYT